MSALSSVKTTLSRKDLNDEAFTFENDADRPHKANLKEIMEAAERQLKVSQELRMKQTNVDLEQAIADEINDEFANEVSEQTKFNPKEVAFANSKETKSGSVKATSQRILELQRKQQSVNEAKNQIESGNQILVGLSKQSQLMTEYLEKVEAELAELENVEGKYKTLRTASEKLAHEFRQLKTKFVDSQRRVSLLEEQQKTDRETSERLQLELSRLNETNGSQQSEIKRHEGVIAKLQDAKLDLEERNKSLLSDKAQNVNKIKELQEKVSDNEIVISDNKKTSVNQKLQLDALSKDNDVLTMDLADIQSRYEKLNNKYSEAKVAAEEFEYKLKAEVTNSEEKIQLKDARIMQLEKSIETLSKAAASIDRVSTSLGLSSDDTETSAWNKEADDKTFSEALRRKEKRTAAM